MNMCMHAQRTWCYTRLQCLIHLITINDNTSTGNRYIPKANHFKFPVLFHSIPFRSVSFHFVVFYSRLNHVHCYVSSSLSFYSPIIIRRRSTMYRSKSILCATHSQPANETTTQPCISTSEHYTLHTMPSNLLFYCGGRRGCFILFLVGFACKRIGIKIKEQKISFYCALLFQKIWAVWYAI